MKDGSWVESLRRERLQHSSRNPGLAALMSFVLMGLGQIYAGHIDKGIILICVHIGGLVTGYSMYTQGLAYDLISSWGGPYLIIPASYVLSVGMILIWIYNIKDAYYLSLFSEFRDWFEVERVLVPFLKGSQVKLLSHHGHPSGVGEAAGEPAAAGPSLPADPGPEADPPPAGRATGSPPGSAPDRNHPADEPEIIDVTATVRPATTPAEEAEGEAPASPRTHRKRSRRPLRGAELLEESGAGGSWKVFGAVGAMVVLVGIWVWNQAQRWHPPGESQATLFSLNGELRAGGAASGAIGAVGRAGRSTGEAIAAASASIPLSAAPAAAGQVEEGLALVKAGETASGVAVLEAALPTTGRAFPEAWRALRQAYFAQDQLAAYEDCLGRYLAVFPEDTEEWVNLAKVQFDRQSYVTASRSLLKALSQVPTHQRANFLMGSIYRELGLPEEAVPYLTKALLTDPLNTEFNRELAATHLALKDLKSARRHLERVMNVTATTGVRDEEAEALLAELEGQERMVLNLTPMVEPVSVAALAAPVDPGEPGPAPAGSAAPSLPSVTNVTEGLPQGGVILYEAPGWSPRRSGTSTQVRNPPPAAAPGRVAVDIGDIAPRESGAGPTPIDSPDRKDVVARPLPGAALTASSPVEAGGPSRRTEDALPASGAVAADLPPDGEKAGAASVSAKVVTSAAPAGPPVAGPERLPPTGLPAPGASAALAVATGSVSGASGISASQTLAVLAASPAVLAGAQLLADLVASGPRPQPASRPSPLEPRLDDIHLAPSPAEPDLADAVAVEDSPGSRVPVPSGSRAADPGQPPGSAVRGSGTVPGKPVPPPPPSDELKGLWAKGFDRYLAGKWEESLPYFLKYLEKREDARVYDMVGVIFEKVGLPRDAYEATRRSHRLGQSDPQTLVRLGLLAEKTGEFAEGARYLDQALKKLPHRVDLVLLLARCHRESGNPAAARTLLQKVAADPKQSYAVKRRVETELAAMTPPAPGR